MEQKVLVSAKTKYWESSCVLLPNSLQNNKQMDENKNGFLFLYLFGWLCF